jgi:hypothetical protein
MRCFLNSLQKNFIGQNFILDLNRRGDDGFNFVFHTVAKEGNFNENKDALNFKIPLFSSLAFCQCLALYFLANCSR